jgi:rhodanese-related sulfurtransferase
MVGGPRQAVSYVLVFGQQVPSVSAAEVPADAYLLDVREDDEWTAGHAPEAHHVPMMEVPARLDDVPTEGDVVVVCRSGGRSGQVVAYLMNNGWDNVRNLAGGMHDWAAAGRPVVSDSGAPAQVI